jgi:hypothetical protein
MGYAERAILATIYQQKDAKGEPDRAYPQTGMSPFAKTYQLSARDLLVKAILKILT